MPHYEFCCIATTAAQTQRLTTLVRRIAFDLQKRGGVVRKVEHYGLRPLAYPIKAHSRKHEVGRYFRLHVQASPVSADMISEMIGNDENIIRHRHFVLPTVDVRAARPAHVEHEPALSEPHYDALRRTTNIDYFIARTLLKLGKITPEELTKLGTHTPNMTTAAKPAVAAPKVLPVPVSLGLAGPTARALFAERRDTLSMDIQGATPTDEAELPESHPLRGLLDALRPVTVTADEAAALDTATLPKASVASTFDEELARARSVHTPDVLSHIATRSEVSVDLAAAAQRTEGLQARAAAYFEGKPDAYSPLADIDKQRV
jgi:ribosomal protein S6